MAQIIWNKRASRQFGALQEYLTEEFGEKTTATFTTRTFTFIELLLKHPQIGSLEDKEKNIRGFVLHSNTTVFYKEEQGNIYILSFFDNRQSPGKEKF